MNNRMLSAAVLTACVALFGCSGGGGGRDAGVGGGGGGKKDAGTGGGVGGMGGGGDEDAGVGGGAGGGAGGGGGSGGAGGGTAVIPPVPQGLTAVAGDGKISLTWTAEPTATRYKLYFLTNSMVSKTRGSALTVAGSPYDHVGPTNGTTYSYVVTAVNSAGESAESNVATATPLIIDLTPPRVVTSRPRLAETAVQLGRPVILRFNEPLDGATVTATTFTFSGPGGPVTGTRTAVGDTVTFTPAAALTPETVYTATATTGVKDAAGNALAADFVLTFTTASAAPTGLTAIQGAGDATLKWNASSGASSYVLSRGLAAAGPFADVAGAMAPFSTERALALGTTYYFVVSAITAFGRSEPSAPLAVTPSAAGAAAAITVTVVPAKTTALLSWAAVAGAVSYNILRAPSPAGPFVQLANVTNVAFLDTGLSPATSYSYLVQTVAGTGPGPYSAEVICVLDATLLSAPTGVTSSSGNTWLELNWNAVPGATGYVVYRQNAPNQAFTGPVNASTSHVLTSLSNGTTYNFLVAAVVGGDAGDFAAVSVTPGPSLAPRVAIATAAQPRINGVTVLFELSPGYTANSLMRATVSGGPYTVVSPNGIDNTAVVGTPYFYVVRAQNGAVNAGLSNEVAATALPATALVAPTGVAATAGNTTVMVSWNPVPGAVSYIVSSGTTSGGPYSGSTCTASYDTRCVLTGTNGTTSFIVVKAQGPTLAGPNSAQVSATPSAALPMPPGVTVNPGNGAIRLTWPNVPGATSYRVYRRTPLTDWSLLASPVGPSYVNTVANSIAYQYAVEAVAAAGNSTWANLAGPAVWASVYEAAVPAGVTAAVGPLQLMVSWSPVPGATSYTVSASLTPGGPYNQGSCVTSDTRCVFGGVNGTPYFFIVQATSSSGALGAPSAEQSAIPLAGLPASPFATFTGGNSAIGFAWNSVPTATSYKVYRRGFNSDWKLLGSSNGLSFIDPVKNGVPYLYAFHSVSAAGSGVWAIPSSGYRSACSLVPVSPPGVTAIAGNGTTTMMWSPVLDATSYSVNASLTPGGPYNQAACTAMGDTHCNLTLANGTQYSVIVTANGTGGASTPAPEVTNTPQSSAPLIPLLTGIAGNNANVVSWPRQTGASTYKVHRRAGAGAWSEVASPSVSIYYDDDVLNAEAFQYAVQPIAGATASAWSVSPAALVASQTLPLPPVISAQPGNGLITLRWTPVAGAASYTMRSSLVQGGPYASSCAPAGAFETVCNAPIANGAAAYLVGQTGNGTAFSTYSAEVTATPSAALSLANNVTPTAVAGKVHLAWVAASGAATSYRIYRRSPTSSPALIAEVTGLTFDDEPLTSGTLYRYWVQPVNAAGAGAWSAAAQIAAP